MSRRVKAWEVRPGDMIADSTGTARKVESVVGKGDELTIYLERHPDPIQLHTHCASTLTLVGESEWR